LDREVCELIMNQPTETNLLNRHFRFPAEWEPQSASWLSWPHNLETWPENLEAARAEFVKLVVSIACSQPVMVMVSGEAHDSAQRALGSVDNVSLVEISTNDAWARDYAPSFVIDSAGQLVAIDWHYNAWGGKYPPFEDDQQVAKRVAAWLGIECVSPKFCFEGGAIEVNDEGILLCTKSCALDPNRNPGLGLQDAESILKSSLGAKKIIWLTGDAIEGDDTDGHIDQLARFTDRKTIVYAWTDDESDSQLAALKQNRDDLRTQLDANGLGHYCLIPLRIPSPQQLCGRRVPASYCNFLITNQSVIVPQFDVPEDGVALATLAPLFPNRKLIGLASKNLSVGLGSFHCLTQQQPKVR
jgi:agmatine deiminase